MGGGFGRQPVVVMGFGIMNGRPIALGDVSGEFQICLNLFTIVILKQFRISPVEIGTIEQIPGDTDLATQTL